MSLPGSSAPPPPLLQLQQQPHQATSPKAVSFHPNSKAKHDRKLPASTAAHPEIPSLVQCFTQDELKVLLPYQGALQAAHSHAVYRDALHKYNHSHRTLAQEKWSKPIGYAMMEPKSDTNQLWPVKTLAEFKEERDAAVETVMLQNSVVLESKKVERNELEAKVQLVIAHVSALPWLPLKHREPFANVFITDLARRYQDFTNTLRRYHLPVAKTRQIILQVLGAIRDQTDPVLELCKRRYQRMITDGVFDDAANHTRLQTFFRVELSRKINTKHLLRAALHKLDLANHLDPNELFQLEFLKFKEALADATQVTVVVNDRHDPVEYAKYHRKNQPPSSTDKDVQPQQLLPTSKDADTDSAAARTNVEHGANHHARNAHDDIKRLMASMPQPIIPKDISDVSETVLKRLDPHDLLVHCSMLKQRLPNEDREALLFSQLPDTQEQPKQDNDTQWTRYLIPDDHRKKYLLDGRDFDAMLLVQEGSGAAATQTNALLLAPDTIMNNHVGVPMYRSRFSPRILRGGVGVIGTPQLANDKLPKLSVANLEQLDDRFQQSREVEELYEQIQRVFVESTDIHQGAPTASTATNTVEHTDIDITPSAPDDGHNTYRGVDDENYTPGLTSRHGSALSLMRTKTVATAQTPNPPSDQIRPTLKTPKRDKWVDDYMDFILAERTDYITDIVTYEPEDSEAESTDSRPATREMKKEYIKGLWRMTASNATSAAPSAVASVASSTGASRDQGLNMPGSLGIPVENSASALSSTKSSKADLSASASSLVEPRRRKTVSFSKADRKKKEKEKLQRRAVRTTQVLQQRLENVWTKLDIPVQERLEMAIQYANITDGGRVKTVLAMWEMAVDGILRREKHLARIENFERTMASDPMRFYKETSAQRDKEAERREIIMDQLHALNNEVATAIGLIATNLNHTVTLHGVPYKDKMAHDYSKILYRIHQDFAKLKQQQTHVHVISLPQMPSNPSVMNQSASPSPQLTSPVPVPDPDSDLIDELEEKTSDQ